MRRLNVARHAVAEQLVERLYQKPRRTECGATLTTPRLLAESLKNSLKKGTSSAAVRPSPARRAGRAAAKPAGNGRARRAEPAEQPDGSDADHDPPEVPPIQSGNGHAQGNGRHGGNGHAGGNGAAVDGNGHSPAKHPEVEPLGSIAEPGGNGQPMDQELVDRCKLGDPDAWAEMHRRCHTKVLRQIRYTLGDLARDANLVEEIAARVWYALVADDGYLLRRYESEKGNSLGSYLSAIARFEVLRHQRSEYRRRRRERETQIMRSQQSDDQLLGELKADLKEFLPQLTRRENEFFHQVLLGNNGVDLDLSAPNAWQLRHRIRRKLLAFLSR